MNWYHPAYRLARRDHSHRYRHDDRPLHRSARARHLSVRPHLAAGTATIVISGQLDLLSTPSLAVHLEQILAQRPQRLVFDLTRVTFMDCAAARLIAGTDRSLPDGQRPVLRRPSAEVRRILELTGLDTRCELARDAGEDEADGRLGRRRCGRSP
ncbi:MAG: STAS domain-containing protein [Streptosporangiaceae bacterium]